MMERKEGEASDSSGASARASSPRCRKEDDGVVPPENDPRASWSPSANTASAADDSQRSSAAAIDQLEQQIRRHLLEQHQHESGWEENQGGLQPQHANDAWGSTMPYPYRRGAAWGGAGVGTPGPLYQEEEALADLRGEATAPSKPLLQVPESELPPLAKSYLFPSSLIAHPAPNSMEPSNMAELSQRMEPPSAFHQGVGGADSHVDGYSGVFLREAADRSSSDMRPRPLRPYSNLSRPSVTTLADAESGPSAFPGRNYGSSSGSGAVLPFPIVTIPFRSTMARPETAAPGAFRVPGMAAAAAAAASTNSLAPLGAGLQWDRPFPTSGKEPTFPMKLHQILASPQFQDCICWNGHGRSWRIIKTQEFERAVIPLFFQHSKYSSFLRQVNGWGFERIVTGADHGSYFSSYFLRDNPRLCLTMKRKAKKKKLMNDGESGPACAPTANSQVGRAATSTSTVTTNWNALSASEAISLGGALSFSNEKGTLPKVQQQANLLARPRGADPSEGQHACPYPRAFSASNVQSSQQPFASSRGAAHSMVGLEELTSRLYSSQSNNAQLSVNPFLQREAQQNQTIASIYNTSKEGFHPISHERIHSDQGGLMPAPEFQPEGYAGVGGGRQVWLPYQQQGTSHLHGGEMGNSSVAPPSRQVNQHGDTTLPSTAHPASSSPRAHVGTSEVMLSSSTSGDDWSPGDHADELGSGVAAPLPLGAMSPLHFGENETNSSTD